MNSVQYSQFHLEGIYGLTVERPVGEVCEVYKDKGRKARDVAVSVTLGTSLRYRDANVSCLIVAICDPCLGNPKLAMGGNRGRPESAYWPMKLACCHPCGYGGGEGRLSEASEEVSELCSSSRQEEGLVRQNE